MAYDEGLLARCLDALRAAGNTAVRTKHVFGMRGLLRGSTMFAAVGEDSMIVKTRADDFEAALTRPGARRFMPGGQTLGTWIELDQDAVADDPDLREWLEAALRAIR